VRAHRHPTCLGWDQHAVGTIFHSPSRSLRKVLVKLPVKIRYRRYQNLDRPGVFLKAMAPSSAVAFTLALLLTLTGLASRWS